MSIITHGKLYVIEKGKKFKPIKGNQKIMKWEQQYEKWIRERTDNNKK